MADLSAEERAEAFWRTPAPDKYERRPIELLAETIREAEQAAAAQARAEERRAAMAGLSAEERAETLLRGREFGHYWGGEFCRSLEIGETLPLVVAAIRAAEQAAAAQAQAGVDALAEEIVALREDLEKADAQARAEALESAAQEAETFLLGDDVADAIRALKGTGK